jgi:hypothetical protein
MNPEHLVIQNDRHAGATAIREQKGCSQQSLQVSADVPLESLRDLLMSDQTYVNGHSKQDQTSVSMDPQTIGEVSGLSKDTNDDTETPGLQRLRFANSFTRMGAVIDLIGEIPSKEWLAMLGDSWSDCDNIRDYRGILRNWLGTSGPIREMMTPEENAAYDALPERVTCHRGCDASAMVGSSWTLDWNVANRFPFLARYRVPSPVVVTATVKKNRILAVKLDRDEA